MSDEYINIKNIGKNMLLIDDDNNLYIKKKYSVSSKDLIIKLLEIQNNINIPKIIEYKTEGEYIYTVETYIQGISLFEYLCKIDIENKIISAEYFNSFLEQILKILYTLHAKGIIHRDIKPENIIITPLDEIFLIDFDISRVYNAKKHKDTTAFGTEYYASPEQYGFRQTDFRSDLYSLGKVLSIIYEHMEENKKIKDLISGLTHIDFTKRYDYNKINSYFNKNPIANNNFKNDNIKFFLPYFNFTRKHILNIILNSFSWFFLFSVSLELLNEFNLNKNSSIFLTIVLTIFSFYIIKAMHNFFKSLNVFKFIKSENIFLKILKPFLYFIYAYILLVLSFTFIYIVAKTLYSIYQNFVLFVYF